MHSNRGRTSTLAPFGVTRSQVKRQEKPVKQLKVIDSVGDDVSRDKLIAMQKQDFSLSKFMKETEQDQKIAIPILR